MRPALFAASLLFASCASRPAPVKPPRDQTKEAWYGQTADQLAVIDRDAERLLRDNKRDDAAALIEKGQPLMNRLLAVPGPTLAATEASADLDDLYGRMLLTNRHYGWARLQFQKNLARWKHWRPWTQESARRLALAASQIAECDRHLPQ